MHDDEIHDMRLCDRMDDIVFVARGPEIRCARRLRRAGVRRWLTRCANTSILRANVRFARQTRRWTVRGPPDLASSLLLDAERRGCLGVVDDGQLLGRVHVLRIRKWRQHRHVVGRADGDRERDRSDDGHEHRSGRDGHDGREHGDDGGEHGDDGRDGDDGARDGDDGRDGLDGIEHGDDGLDGVDDRHGDERRAAPG